jgi:NAD(P)-dependent dehydrogenase (short-subunit alcohol dehydrogenase family)
MTTLHGKTALTTGGSIGIGFAAAERLAAEGAQIMLIRPGEVTDN